MLVKLTRLAVGNDHPAALDKATDLGGLARAERDRMRQYRASDNRHGARRAGFVRMTQTGVAGPCARRMGKLPRARSDRVILILRARSAPAPFLGRRSSVEQPLDAPARRRVEDADRLSVPPAVDQQGANAVSYLPEIRRRCASPVAEGAVFADKLAACRPTR